MAAGGDTGSAGSAGQEQRQVPEHAMPTAFQVTVQPAGWRFSAPSGVSLLTAAQAAGIRLARSCRNGTCRACLCHLRTGKVRYSIDWPGLSADEKAEGCILPCVAQPLSDVVIDAPGATLIPKDPA